MDTHTVPSLCAICPLDGRYGHLVDDLRLYFSEAGLTYQRIQVEAAYLEALVKFLKKDVVLPPMTHITTKDVEEIKSIERECRHDVKSVVYWLQDAYKKKGVDEEIIALVHLGLTSQDVTSVANALLLKKAMDIVDKDLMKLIQTLMDLVSKDSPMLGRTHGQPATPTTMWKELQVFVERLSAEDNPLTGHPLTTKFGGATGTLAAHNAAYPDLDWAGFATDFCESLGLHRQVYTTQIDHYDGYAKLLDWVKRLATICIDFARDMWTYISLNYFTLKVVEGEVGSSTMPHKVNPIDFENGEGNLEMARGLSEVLARRLPTSRLQRDLTDSTLTRNLGMPFGYLLLGLRAICRGLERVSLNKEALTKDLDSHPEVLAEAYQTILRREGRADAYDTLKDLVRGKALTLDDFHEWIDGLEVEDSVKVEMKSLTPSTYLGVFRTRNE